MPVCLSRTLTFLATHSLACCDKGRQDQQTLLSRRDRTTRRAFSPALRRARHHHHPHSPAHHHCFLRTNPARPEHKEPAAHQRTGEKKASRAKLVTTTLFFLTQPTLYSFQAGDQPKSPQPAPKDPVPGSRRSGPTIASWDHLVFPHAASVGNLGLATLTGRVIETRGHPEAGHGHPYLSLARADTRAHAPKESPTSPPPRPITHRDRLQVLKGVR